MCGSNCDENVLVIPVTLFHELGYFQGFSAEASKYLPELFSSNQFCFMPRKKAEHDPNWKQLIPYMLCRYTDPAGQMSFFRYTRGKGMGEGRLHLKHSVGVGGHISLNDDLENDMLSEKNKLNIYRQGMMRELNEEVTISCSWTQTVVGMINDDETDVGKVHLGIVHILDLEAPALKPHETDLIDSGFYPVEELLKEPESYETWSSITLKALFSKPVEP